MINNENYDVDRDKISEEELRELQRRCCQATFGTDTPPQRMTEDEALFRTSAERKRATKALDEVQAVMGPERTKRGKAEPAASAGVYPQTAEPADVFPQAASASASGGQSGTGASSSSCPMPTVPTASPPEPPLGYSYPAQPRPPTPYWPSPTEPGVRPSRSCHFCGEVGHIQRDCPHQARGRGGGGGSSASGARGSGSGPYGGRGRR